MLLGLRQVGNMRQYWKWKEFKVLSGPMDITEHEHLNGIFMNGLKKVRAELKCWLNFLPLGSLSMLMDFTQMIDEKMGSCRER